MSPHNQTAPAQPENDTNASAEAVSSLVELARVRATQLGSQRLYTFETSNGTSAMSYEGLDTRARQIASQLHRHAQRGDRALLLYAPGLEYIAGFFGCLYAGVVPVPAYPPGSDRSNRSLSRVLAILDDAAPACLLTTQELAPYLQESFRGSDRSLPPILTTDTMTELQLGHDHKDHEPAADDIAFLQYTSGSTGKPKGVMLSHRNLLENLLAIQAAFELDASSKGVIWLPPYHDMGLIGGILAPLYAGFEVVLFSPADFAARPLRWLDAISRHRATISGGPSSAFEMCTRRARSTDLSKLDLSSWRLAFVGAEPIAADAIANFSELFAPCGFELAAMLPCYGLAEATLLVTSGRRGQGIRRLDLATDALANREIRTVGPDAAASLHYVSCGLPQQTTALRIVDPESRELLPANSVGEVWISGPSVAHGYFKDPSETEAVFRGRAASDQAPADWLRTGDLGALLDDGELLITGRLKDLVIVHGVNYHPQDIERTAALSSKEIRAGRVIVFSIPVHGREQVACVAEVGRSSLSHAELSAMARALRASVSSEHGVGVHTIAFVAPSVVPRTSSGKLQRRECRALLLEGNLPTLYIDSLSARSEGVGRAPQTPHEQRVAALFTEILGATAVGVDDDFFDLGGTSLTAAQVAARIADETRMELALQAILVGRTVSAIAQWLSASVEAVGGTSTATLASQDILTRMCAIAAEVLGVSEVNPTADFFAMGGTSLSAMLIFARVDQEFNVELPLEAMLELKDMQHLAEKIERSLHSAQAAAGDDASEEAPILKLEARPRPANLPLSFAQQRLWLLDSFRSATLAYTIPIGLRLRGNLNVVSLERTFAAIVLRHEALRTTFRVEEGQPVQIVHAALETWPIQTSERLNKSGAQRDAICDQVGRDDVLQPFDLLRGPLFRTELVRFAPDDHFLLVSMHHIVSDGWSISVLLREFIAYYSAFAEHGSAARVPLPALAIQYPDFALWEREVFTERRLRTSLTFFRTQLEDVPSLRLPTTFARPEQPTGRGKVFRFTVPAALAQAAQQLTARESATLFMVTMTAFRTLLSVLCEQSDFALGVPVANRSRPQLEPLIGFFVNTLALRVRLDDDPSFSEMLARERRGALLSFGHQEVPFDKVVEALGKTRDLRSHPVVSAMFALQNVPLGALALPDLDTTPHWGIGESSKFELTLSLIDWQDETFGMVEYSTDLFDDAAIRKLAEMYQRVLALACMEPDTRLSAFRAVVFEADTDHEAFLVRCLEQRAARQIAPDVADTTPPSNDTERVVQELCAEVLDGRQLGVHSDFIRSGGNSLRAVLLLARVQQHFDIEVPIEAFFAEPHIAGLARQIEARRRATPEPHSEATLDGGNCIAFSQDLPNGSNGHAAPTRIFLVHEIHGDIFCYRTLAAEFGPGIVVYGVPAPATPISSIPALAEHTLSVIRRVQEHGPYIIGGFSFGGVVAHEMARQLEQLGEPVSALLLLDAHAEILGRTPDDATRAAIRAEIDELAATLPVSQRMKRVEGALARLAALEQHTPGRVTTHSLLVRAAKFDGPRDLGWTSFVPVELSNAAVPAYHGTLLKPPFASEVALLIRDHLAKATKQLSRGQ